MRYLERYALLNSIDDKWIDHLSSMEMLREGIGLRAYGQKDPRIEYIHEAFEMFEGLKTRIQEDTVQFLFRVKVHDGSGEAIRGRSQVRVTRTNRDDDGRGTTFRRAERKVGRNEQCPCGSGRKFKRCHGAA